MLMGRGPFQDDAREFLRDRLQTLRTTQGDKAWVFVGGSCGWCRPGAILLTRQRSKPSLLVPPHSINSRRIYNTISNLRESSRRCRDITQKKSLLDQMIQQALCKYPGSVLLSHSLTAAVSSALESLTSVFGMGTGVTPPAWPPRILICIGVPLRQAQGERSV